MSPSFVLFLDVLGVKALARSDAAADTLILLDAAVNEGRRLAEDTAHLPWWATSWFSDSVCLCTPIRGQWGREKGEPELGTFLSVASGVQFSLALQGFFSRGGASFGMQFSDSNVTFGSALVDAVHIEASVEKPCIGVDSLIVSVARQHLAFYGNPPAWAPHDGNLRVCNGQVFVNYLYSAYDFVGETIHEAAELLERHRDHVRRNLLDASHSESTHAKYEWLADYHNDFCRTEGVSDLAIGQAPGLHRSRSSPRRCDAMPTGLEGRSHIASGRRQTGYVPRPRTAICSSCFATRLPGRVPGVLDRLQDAACCVCGRPAGAIYVRENSTLRSMPWKCGGQH
jgi:hypothetical protein